MVTRYRVGTNRPTQRYTLNVFIISPILKSYSLLKGENCNKQVSCSLVTRLFRIICSSDIHYTTPTVAKTLDTISSKTMGTNTDDLIVKLLSKLGLDNNNSGTGINNHTNTASSLTVATTSTLPVAYQTSGPPHPTYFSPPTPIYSPELRSIFSVKDFMTSRVLLRCDSTVDLYPVTAPSPVPHAFLVSQHTWHQRLGHPGSKVSRRLVSNYFISCNKEKTPAICHACQLGKHVRLPFVSSETVVTSCFDIIHSDVWTSPISSLSGFKYYVLFLDHYSHFVWVCPLINKSNVLSKFVLFRNYVRTQFQYEI
ncbi:ribonuclease H-like domain-containing protein [Tanacetum coccineum]